MHSLKVPTQKTILNDDAGVLMHACVSVFDLYFTETDKCLLNVCGEDVFNMHRIEARTVYNNATYLKHNAGMK